MKTFSRFFFFFLFSASVFIQACGQVSQVSTPNQINPFANVTGNSLGFDVDPPFFTLDANGNQKGLDTAFPGACGNVVLSWFPATDLVSLNNIIYYIYQSLTPGGENFSAPPTYQTVQFHQTNYLVQNLLPNTTYYYVVRARDEAGNLSVIDPKNLVERTVTTWAPRVTTGAGPNLYCPGGYAPITAAWLAYAGDPVQLTGSAMGSVTQIGFIGAGLVPATAASTGVQATVPAGALSGVLTTSAGSTSDAFLSFPLPVNLSNNATTSNSPAMAVSGSNIGAVWSDFDQPNEYGTIYYSRSPDNGTTFLGPVPVSSLGRNSSDPSVAFDAGGNIYVTWTDNDLSDKNTDIYYSWSSTNGTSFSTPINISWNGGNSTSARVSAFGGNVSVVWSDDSVLYGLTSVWGSTSTDVYLAGNKSRIYHSIDLGQSWTRQNYNFAGSSLNAIWGSSANDVYAVGDGGVVFHTTGTLNWSGQSVTSANLTGVWGSPAGDVYAVGTGGMVFHTTGAWNWTGQSITSANLNAIWGSSASDIYIAADNGTVFHSTGNGVWSSAAVDGGTSGLIPNNLLSIWGTTCTPTGASASVNVVYAGAAAGKIIKKSGASDWESQSVVIGGDFNVNGLWGASSSTCPLIYGVQGDGPVVEWNGVSWRPFLPDSTQGEIVYRQFPQITGPSYPLAAPVTLSNASNAVPPRTAESPEILLAGNNLWFAWTERTAATTLPDQSSLYLSRTDGISFSLPATPAASPSNCFSYQIPQMAYDGIGKIYLVLQESYQYDAAPAWNCVAYPSSFYQIRLASFAIPGTGLPASPLAAKLISFSSGLAQHPVIAASGPNLTAVWEDTSQDPSQTKDELFLITSPDGGVTFTPPVDLSSPFLTDPNADSTTPFLVNSGGTFYLGWTQDLWPVGVIGPNAEVFFSRF